MFVKLKKDALGQKAGYQFDTDEPVGKSLIEQGVAEAVAGDPLAPIIAKSMETMVESLNKGLTDHITATLKTFAEQSQKSLKNAVPAIFGEDQKGDPKKTFGAFLLAVQQKNYKALEEMGSSYVDWDNPTDPTTKKAALNTMTGTQGGFLVPVEFHEKLMQLAVEREIVRKRATHIPMRAKNIQVPALDHVTVPASGDTAFLGGVVARWTEEAGPIPETEPTFKQIDLINYELAGYSKLSNSLLSDTAIGLEKFLMTLFSRAVGWYEDYAFLRGDGVGKPLGILNWPGLISVTRSAASAFALEDAANMLTRLLPGWSAASTCWVMHPTVMAKLIQMQAEGAGGDVIWIDNAREKPRMILLGVPIEVSEKVPALNVLGDVMLIDGQHYLIGDREQIEIAYSEHVAFLNNQSVWRFVSRVGGRPWLQDKVTLADTTSTLAPFVALAAG